MISSAFGGRLLFAASSPAPRRPRGQTFFVLETGAVPLPRYDRQSSFRPSRRFCLLLPPRRGRESFSLKHRAGPPDAVFSPLRHRHVLSPLPARATWNFLRGNAPLFSTPRPVLLGTTAPRRFPSRRLFAIRKGGPFLKAARPVFSPPDPRPNNFSSESNFSPRFFAALDPFLSSESRIAVFNLFRLSPQPRSVFPLFQGRRPLFFSGSSSRTPPSESILLPFEGASSPPPPSIFLPSSFDGGF